MFEMLDIEKVEKKFRECKRCMFCQPRQGKGKRVDCQRMPVKVEKRDTDWCGEFKVNTDKFHRDGKKIYTRIDTKQMTAAPTGTDI